MDLIGGIVGRFRDYLGGHIIVGIGAGLGLKFGEAARVLCGTELIGWAVGRFSDFSGG